jgi:hypothetical protein
LIDPAPTSPLDVVSFSPGNVVINEPIGRSIVTLLTSYDPSWEMVTDDGRRVSSTPLDGVNGWYLPDATGGRIEFVRSGERLVQSAALVSLLAVLVCVWLIVRRRSTTPAAPITSSDRVESEPPEPVQSVELAGPNDPLANLDDLADLGEIGEIGDEPNPFSLHWFQPGDVIGPEWFLSEPTSAGTASDSDDESTAAPVEAELASRTGAAIPRRTTALAVSLSVIGAVLLIGWLGLFIAAGASLLVLGNHRSKALAGRSIDAIPALLLFLAAVASVAQQALGSDGLGLRYAADQRWAHQLTLMSFAFLAALVPLRWLSERRQGRPERDVLTSPVPTNASRRQAE